MRYLFMVLVCLPLTGCAVQSSPSAIYSTPAAYSPPPPPPPPQVKVKHDDFQKLTTYEGENCAPSPYDLLLLRAVKVDVLQGPPSSYVTYVSTSYVDSDWHSYNRADDIDGHELPLHSIDHKVNNCSAYVDKCAYREDMTLKVSREYLLQHQSTGIHFQLSGKWKHEEFRMQGSYVQAFMSKLPQ